MSDLSKNFGNLNFVEMIRKIERKEIILPDFQRSFVWKDEEQQKKIIASVLARMPIGSILLLKSKPDEYSSKFIGCKKNIDTSSIKGDVEFLLDGQQRITVLSSAFSDIIYKHCEKVSELVSPTLKRRFFLMIPKWRYIKKEDNDIFGVYNLSFKYQHPETEEPDFLSGDIYEFIKCETFMANGDEPINPYNTLSSSLDEYCVYNANKEYYLVPLYLLAPPDESRNSYVTRLEKILEKISMGIHDDIISHYENISDEKARNEFVHTIVDDENTYNEILKNPKYFVETVMEEKKLLWKSYFDGYIKKCVSGMLLNEIVVEEEKRARAIDIYENLNKGGISLSTFDLVMAKVAKVSKENFQDRIISYMNKLKEYNSMVLPEIIKSEIESDIISGKYNATLKTGCYNESKNEIMQKYIDAFLNVMSLYCNNKDFDADKYSVDWIKRKKILEIDEKDIDKKCEEVCNAIDRAMFFFQTRCGIRNIKDMNYSLMIVLVAVVFLNKDFFENKNVHNILEAWYWSSVFSGEFDKDQNTRIINDLSYMIKTLKNNQNTDWIKSRTDNVLSFPNFSDKELLLMNKVNEDRYPKEVLGVFICQYFLACTYTDMFDNKKIISVFCDEAENLEKHHIITLGSAKKVGESSKNIRKDNKHICNSPLNFVYITKNANIEISDKTLDEYAKIICDEARASLKINVKVDSIKTEENMRDVLENRYSAILGDMKNKINTLLK